MTTYEAEIGPDSTVSRVIVSPATGWGLANLGGTWQETSDPYAPAVDDVRVYAGIGYGFDKGVPEAFVADHWDSTKATTPDLETGEYFYAENGMLTWFEAKAWRNLLPTGSPNTFPPPTNWREYPLDENGVPIWVQPSGAFDAYPIDFVVSHLGVTYRSVIAANTTTPGTDERFWEAQ